MSNEHKKFKKGDRVKAINPHATYKVLCAGPKFALVRCDDPGFQDLRFSVPVSILRNA